MSRGLLACVVVGVVVATFVAPGNATRGVDVSTAVYPDNWKCLRKNGYAFAVIRAWQSNGVPDPNSPHTIYNAWDGGMKDVDVYLFPDSAANPEDQVGGLVDYLARYNISCRSRYGPPHTFGMLWLDIEAPQLWSSSQDANRNFIQGMMDEAARRHVALGIYTSASQWGPITGDWTGGSRYPLWYAHYDNNPSFSDFAPFGGWTHPSIKQYTGTSDVCGAGVDNDWYPN